MAQLSVEQQALRIVTELCPYISSENYNLGVSTAEGMLEMGGGNCFAYTEAVVKRASTIPGVKGVFVTLSAAEQDGVEAIHATPSILGDGFALSLWRPNGDRLYFDSHLQGAIAQGYKSEGVVYRSFHGGKGSDFKVYTKIQDPGRRPRYSWPKESIGHRLIMPGGFGLEIIRTIVELDTIRKDQGESAFRKAKALHTGFPRLPKAI